MAKSLQCKLHYPVQLKSQFFETNCIYQLFIKIYFHRMNLRMPFCVISSNNISRCLEDKKIVRNSNGAVHVPELFNVVAVGMFIPSCTLTIMNLSV